MTSVNCSIIIRCLNEERHLPRLLDSIKRQTLRPCEVIVVDSGSTDQTVQIARSRGARIVRIDPQEFSFGRALNLGAQVASGDILVLVSAHTYPCNDTWLINLTQVFSDPAVALVYGGQAGDHRSKFSERQLFQQWFPSKSCDNQTHSFCNNANAAIRRSIWLTMPYDEQIPALEDIHWAKRAIERGFRIVYKAEAGIVHLHDESYRQICRRYRREGMGLRMIVPWETMTFAHACSLAASAIRSDIHEARAEGIFRKTLTSIFCFRLAQYWGTYRGLQSPGTLTSDLRARLYYPKSYHLNAQQLLAVPESDPSVSLPEAGKRGE